MSTLSAYSQMTLPEANKREGFEDLAAALGELAQMIDILDVMPWVASTNGTFNKQFQFSNLGKGAFSKANTSIPSIASTGEVVEEPVKLYVGESVIDETILSGVDDPTAVRDSEDGANLEGAFQDWAYNLLYGSDTANSDNFFSFDQRRPALTGYSPYVFGGGGTGSTLTSAWLLELSPRTLCLVYPGNSGTPGFKNEDRGRWRVPAADGTSGQMWAWIRRYEIWGGIVMRNARAIMRYCNIASSGSSNTFSITDFVRYGKNQLQNVGRNAFLFVNRELKGQIEAQAYKDTQNGALTIQAIEGLGPVTFVAGIPVRMHEGITTAESALT